MATMKSTAAQAKHPSSTTKNLRAPASTAATHGSSKPNTTKDNTKKAGKDTYDDRSNLNRWIEEKDDPWTPVKAASK